MSKSLSKKNYAEMLRKHISRKECIKIVRTFKGEEDSIRGVLLGQNRNFIWLQIEYDFQFDGYAVIPIQEFDSIRFNAYDKVSTRILKAEKIINDSLGLDVSIDFSSFQTMFKDLRYYDIHVVIEREHLGAEWFEIGIVKRVSKDSVSIRYYDPAGVLEKKLTPIKYKDITIVKFLDRYTTTFRKYLREPKK